MTLETVVLRPGFDIPRIAKGNWQIADDHSGRTPAARGDRGGLVLPSQSPG